MGQKNNKKIILISIILLVILILIVGVAFTYFATDIFKSNKELFFKYMTQIGDEKEGLIEQSLKEYFSKQENTPYSDEGSIAVNITANDGQEQFEATNNMNLTFDGQVDKANSQNLQNISLNYSDSVQFPLTYKRVGNTLGIQTNYIGSKYIVTNTNETDFLTDDTKDLMKVQELVNVELTQEDLQHIKDTYLNVLNEQLDDNKFSKIEENNTKGYKLILDGETFKNLIVNLLETLKSDQTTLDKLNEYVKIQKNSSKITVSSIDNFIKDIENNSELNNENLEIIVYKTKGKISSFVIKMNEAELKLEKILTGNDLQYSIQLQSNINNQFGKIGFIAKFAGLQSMQSITENYEFTLEMEDIKYQYNYNNIVEFTDSIQIEDFDDSNSLILDEMEEEGRESFMDAVIQRIQNVSKSQMEELGLEEDENPLNYVLPSIFNNSILYNGSEISEEEVTTFNRKFELYESTNLQGVTVKGLLSTIQLNNDSQEDDNRKIKEIHFDGEEYEVTDQNITLLKSSVETETAYRVEFEKDEDTGLIYRAVINKK